MWLRSCACKAPEHGRRFILMDHIEGVETGVGAYFNGERFLRPACLDWEHKRFFAGNMGELTGKWAPSRHSRVRSDCSKWRSHPLEALFREAGHIGWVNLNTIINEEGVWPHRVHLPLRLPRICGPRAAAGDHVGWPCSSCCCHEALPPSRIAKASRRASC